MSNESYWCCSVCGKRVSRDARHADLRTRRSNGWDHARCQPEEEAHITTVEWLVPVTPSPLTKDEAKKLTTEIKSKLDDLWDLVAEAYVRRAWTALGYKSWDDYCCAEFGSTRLRLPKEERSQAISSLREFGLSLRAISSATGSSVNTIRKDLGQVCQSDTPKLAPIAPPGAPTPATPGMTDRVQAALSRAANRPEIDVACVTKQPDKPIVGTDGKKYNGVRDVVKDLTKRKRSPLTNQFPIAIAALSKTIARLNRIAADDRFTRNASALRRYRHELINTRDAVDKIILRLEQAPASETAIVVDMFPEKSGDPQ